MFPSWNAKQLGPLETEAALIEDLVIEGRSKDNTEIHQVIRQLILFKLYRFNQGCQSLLVRIFPVAEIKLKNTLQSGVADS
jgi:hypothetical protein